MPDAAPAATAQPASPPPPAPDADAIRAETRRAERERIAAIDATFLGLPALADIRRQAIDDGLSLDQAKALAFDALAAAGQKALADKDAQLAAAHARLKAIASGGADVTAPDPSDLGQQSPAAAAAAGADDGRPETYQAAYESAVAAGKSRADAHRAATLALPKSKEAWIRAANATARAANA